jgi:hypothetical protein
VALTDVRFNQALVHERELRVRADGGAAQPSD